MLCFADILHILAKYFYQQAFPGHTGHNFAIDRWIMQ
jgi:hypothetical protein